MGHNHTRLSSFQALEHTDTIDIPGQYTGASPPTQVATIQRFDQRLLVMSSIRKPKRLSILGSDEKDHLFLVKVTFVATHAKSLQVVARTDAGIGDYLTLNLTSHFYTSREERIFVWTNVFSNCLA